MKKIMFDDLLEKATIAGLKDKTRRIISDKLLSKAEDYVQKVHGTGHDFMDYLLEHSPYKVGEIVAVAQRYRDITAYLTDSFYKPSPCYMRDKAGWSNKMYVRSDLMPHQIRFIDIRVERLQDISDEDCLKEGIEEHASCCECGTDVYAFDGAKETYYTPREAFAALIDKVSRKKVWADNPYVFVYSFERVK